MKSPLLLLVTMLMMVQFFACAAARPVPEAETVPGLPNLHRIAPQVWTGAQPEGAAAFAALRHRGVATVLSVDGAMPDVAAATAAGLRYVHLPVSYDGVTPDQARHIAQAIRDADGGIYIHCHHGRHRGPAAACSGAVMAGVLDPTRVDVVLTALGTGAQYRGLWASARTAQPLPVGELAALHGILPSRVAVPELVAGMVDIDTRLEHLRLVQQAAWMTPVDHPDIDPEHEALLLKEAYAEMVRNPHHAARGEAFLTDLRSAAAGAVALEDGLRSRMPGHDGRLQAVAAACTGCHRMWRDAPGMR